MSGSNCWIACHSVPPLFSLVGVLWRTKQNTIDAILIQWHANNTVEYTTKHLDMQISGRVFRSNPSYLFRLRAVPLCSYSPSRAEGKKTGRAEVGSAKVVVWAKGEKKRDYRQSLSVWPLTVEWFLAFISNLINRNQIISLILTACQFWSVIAFIAVNH